MKNITSILILLALAVLGTVVFNRWRSGAAAPTVPVVAGLPAARVPGDRVKARALGKIESASDEIAVASDITGRIAEIHVEEGQVVARGEKLARLEPFVFESKVKAARAALAQAVARKKLLDAGARSEEINAARALLSEMQASERVAKLAWERYARLLESGDISQHQADAVREEALVARERVRAVEERLLIAMNQTRQEEKDAAEAEVEVGRHELAVAEAELEKTVLRAPIAGTIIRKNLRVGEAVSPFQISPVVTLADLSDLRVRAEVDEIDLAHVRVGQKVELEALLARGQPLHGTVLRIGNSMGRKKVESNDPNERVDVRVLEVLIDLDDKGDGSAGSLVLPLGLRVNVSFLD